MGHMDKGSNTIRYTAFALGLALGGVLCFLGLKAFGPSDRRNQLPGAFYLGVKVTFPSLEDKLKFHEEFIPLSEYVRQKEFTTVSYEVLQSDKDRLQIYILERYTDKNAYLDIHKKSKEFLAFRAKFQELIDEGAKVDGDSYMETGIGFI
mmetsp:Transcript_21465/g.35926  ORF Transcript_21465/g.35926 Transcript_21465/m.35926 type:complete len:150 (+) Transcript_21465:74-523(+)